MVTLQELHYIVNHVFLPRKLPHNKDGEDLEDVSLLAECERAWELFKSHLPPHESPKLDGCSSMLKSLRRQRDPSGNMIPERLEAMLGSMTGTDILAFHMRSQNAALIIRKIEDLFSFESFELAPTNKAVMSSKGRLQRYFPGPAILLSEDRMEDPSFRKALVQLMTSLDEQTPPEAMPIAPNAQPDTTNVPDTVHPKFVAEMLSGILRGIGKPHALPRIAKRTRDDVLWDGTGEPWRRSPFWLLLRVALQTSLHVRDDIHHTYYKSFMVFFMSNVLQLSLDASVSSDLLFSMSAKISRRLLKMGLPNDTPWIEGVHRVIEATQQELASRWAIIEQSPDPYHTQTGWDPSTLSFEQDTKLSLNTLGPYLRSIPFRHIVQVEKSEFTPQSNGRIESSGIDFPSLHTPEGDVETALWLADIELWVEDSLSAWVEIKGVSQNATTLLCGLIESYTTVAFSTYAGNPEDVSLMLLSAMDLWVALDKCAIQHCSMLSQYNPEFPESIFAHLLLPKRSQMKRLSRIEEYLQQRRYLITTSVFQSVSFASQFFEQSVRHQLLRRRIEADAQAARSHKRNELREAQQRYQELMHDSEARTCEYGTHLDRGRQQTHHSPNCRKCQIKWSANRLEIGVHEWPLPVGEYAIKAAVFELEVPQPLEDWRNATYLLLVDVFSPSISQSQEASDDEVYYMKDYKGLSDYTRSKSSRLQLASSSKSFLHARYPSKPVFEATEHNICVNNGLAYSLYDTKLKKWTKDLLGKCDIRKICTFQLPPGPYEQLQFSLAGTEHSSNEVLAMQYACPETITLHEFYAFATLRSGNRLQWRNIARELASRVLNFSLEETHLLILQAVWEVGKAEDSGIYRDSHVDLGEEEFGTSLLMALNEALDAVEGSWQGAVALRTFVVLALRNLSLSPFKAVKNQCLLFLTRARAVSLHWTHQVRSFLDDTKEVSALTDMNLRVLEMALTCHETFDVERNDACEIFSSANELGAYVECSIIIHDHCPAVTKNLPQSIKSLLRKFRRRCHRLETSFRYHVLKNQQSIDETIHRIWSGYHRQGAWEALPAPNERWLVTFTKNDQGYSQLTVHYNMLDGSLLVDGLPLSRLPQSYRLHATYRRFFGEKVLSVVPSSMNGMEFETRSGFFGQEIHFSMIDSDLIIRTRSGSKIYELVPINYLEGDFPKALVHDYAHWLRLDTGSVEWRLMSRAWEPSEACVMQRDSDRNFRLICDGKPLVDIRSGTFQKLSRVLSPLEYATHIHVLYDGMEGELNIHLPRYKLDFILKREGTLVESKQFRNMVVDEAQSVGTFTGLVNKLVLRNFDGTSRVIVVPHGHVSFTLDSNHVRVRINTDGAVHVQHHSYAVDTQLGRLIDNGTLQSRLFRIYMHACTSHCLIDQLTGRTGTEEAINCLSSGATRSFIALEETDVELLESLAQLTPQRMFFPEYLRESQQVEWQELPPFAHHGRYLELVRSIFDQATSSHIFQDSNVLIPLLGTRGMQYLLDRASIRDASFQVEGFGAECHTAEYDVVYASRDQTSGSYRELQACHTARLVENWSQSLMIHPHLLLEIEGWGEPIRNLKKEDSPPLGFDVRWLDAPSKFLPASIYTLHHQLTHASREHDMYGIMVLLSTLAYSEFANLELVQTFLAFATVPELRVLELPDYPVLLLTDGYVPQRQKMAKVVASFALPFEDCPESKLTKLPGETRRIAERRRQDEYIMAKDQEISDFVSQLMLHSTSGHLSELPHSKMNSHILEDEATKALLPWFESWHRNALFKDAVERIQIVLDQLRSEQEIPELYAFPPPSSSYVPKTTNIRFHDLTKNAAPQCVVDDSDDLHIWIDYNEDSPGDHAPLRNLLDRVISRGSSKHDKQYAKDLLRSFEALGASTSASLEISDKLVTILKKYLTRSRCQENYVYRAICTHLKHGEWQAFSYSHMLPRLSKLSILSRLTSDNINSLPLSWQNVFMQYGLSVAVLQRSERLLAAAGTPAELLNELRNLGHRNWQPKDQPEWLLMEIESNVLIRQEQSQVAQEMISPSSGSNSVLQLSMGLGKSSVIIPVAAATLADRTKLVRVVVLKPLAIQMFNLLRRKLGGLLNRQVFYMPISRSTKFDQSTVLQMRTILEQCMRTGGILLVQPEHILSFELMGFEKLLSNEQELGATLIKTQKWLEDNSRDLIDESDEILSVKYELIYTMGTQEAIDFSPERWNVIHGVLDILNRCAQKVVRSFPDGLEIISGQSGAFPRIRIVQKHAGDALINAVARKVCENGIPGVPVWRLPTSFRDALFKFLISPTWSVNTEALDVFFSGSKSVEKALLLLKGLFGKGVLRFCFEQKRWRVQYGLHPSRTKLAVPYHAKDCPAPRAEFSHPDATIILTYLSYYYGGLSDEQLFASFEALLKSDHASEEYTHWVQDAANIPHHFRQLTGINLGNTQQCRRDLFPSLRFTTRIINFYLSNLVFPDLKEFPQKLSSSGWDIAREKKHPTTGFSGTNDSRYHLPLSVHQRDLPQQLSTNADVLGRILKPENTVVDILESSSGVINANALIKLAAELNPPARVILDVGAQVLELENEKMAWKWLSSVPELEAQAVIFFDAHNDVCVMSRDGMKELLEVSPYLRQMDACLVYLDEAHTRGTDLKMPANYRAIVTIGPGLIKDRLTQACMRMRKLGEGQSVAFCFSTEIQTQILDHMGKIGGKVEVSDVLDWCIANTCSYSKRSVPLWVTQGLRYLRRHIICSQSTLLADGEVSDNVVKYLPEKEAQTLQERYGNGLSQIEAELFSGDAEAGKFSGHEQQVAEIRARYEDFGMNSFGIANLYEEQERELSPENEREKQVDRPPLAVARKHTIHPDVRSLAAGGVLKRSSEAFTPAFGTLSKTIADAYEEKAWPRDLIVTADFAVTVQGELNKFLDSYTRPVNWILSCMENGHMSLVIISPFEVQELLPLIRKNRHASLHVYAPCINLLSRRLDELSFCAVPPAPKSWLPPPVICHLNIFAGQLYMKNYEEYVALCGFLGISHKAPEGNMEVGSDGFVAPSSRDFLCAVTVRDSPFMKSPVEFLRGIVTMRRKGQNFTMSHLGMILNGELIPREKFERRV